MLVEVGEVNHSRHNAADFLKTAYTVLAESMQTADEKHGIASTAYSLQMADLS